MKLRVFLPDQDRLDPATRLAWVLYDARGTVLRTEATTLPDIPRATEVDVVLPASRVLFARLKLPRVNAATIRELLPFAVEDRLVADPAQIHAVPGPTNARGETVVAVVDREGLQASVTLLTQAGLKPTRAWCESALLAGGHADWHAVVGPAHGFLADDEGMAVAFDRSGPGLPLALRAAMEEGTARGSRPAVLQVHSAAGAALPDLAAWSAQAGVPCKAGGPWEEIAASPLPRGAIDLLQGDFAERRARFGSGVPRAAAVLAVLVLALQLGFTAVDAWRLEQQGRDLLQRQEATFRASFPQAQVVVDAPLQMARNLADLKRSRGLAAEDDFLVQATLAGREFPAGAAKSLQFTQGRLEVVRVPAPAGAPK